MLSLLLGPDDFSKKEYIHSLAEKQAVRAEFFVSADNVPGIGYLAGQDLFSKTQIFVLENLLSGFDLEKNLSALADSANHIILTEPKLDKRTKFSKELLADKRVEVKEFPLPHGKELDRWIIERFKKYGASIAPEAADLLAVRLGRDSAQEIRAGGKVIEVQEVYSLWQAENEIKKLVAYKFGGTIEAADVDSLVSANEDIEVFDILNALGTGDKQKTLRLINIFLSADASGDEKAKLIQLNALLADQFRNIYVLQSYLAQRLPDAAILEKTSWKSGRLFVLRKIAAVFKPRQVVELLHKLEALDEELKTSGVPARVVIDLIISQA